ncbi:transcriptional regulator [Haloarcula sp. S1AR25-5A]|uniref:Transcriptional regulator n=1 Tax=Haloarcula terrestris TaxID=2950533 RepID=A0AAE4EW42_9EURY|nr:transcriptional regulator [Haloarcula terrestris]MDS0221037.1 transcriptional regulator [Haloarcula terrestris]
MSVSAILERLADDFASAVPAVDNKADHDRWQAGIGPFEEENQIEMLREEMDEDTSYFIKTEEPYLDGGQRADVFIESADTKLPVEAKLLRFRYDNGNIDPNSFAKVFSPFPERTTSTLLTDARKLYDAGFAENGGLLGLYYEPVDESYERMSPEAIAEKFCLDVDYWYDFEVETRSVAHFDGLRHPIHQQGAVITWEITG